VVCASKFLVCSLDVDLCNFLQQLGTAEDSMDASRWFQHLLRWLAVLGGTAAGFALAGTRDPHTPDERYQAFGEKFPFVVEIHNVIDCSKCNEVHAQKASAVTIRPNWLITAAHVVKDAVANTAVVDGEDYQLPYVVWPKEFEEGKLGWHDIALCYSPKDFNRKFYTPLYRKADENGKAVTIAGFGAHGTFETGAKHLDNKRRAGHNRVAGEEHAVLLCRPRQQGKAPLEFLIASGDSGGGLFIGNELAGINSFVTATDGKPDSTYGDEAGFTRISLYADWIEQQIEKYEQSLKAQATMGADIKNLAPVR